MNINQTILFGCPIYKIKVDPTSYDKESLLKIIINNYSKDEYRNKFDNDKSSLHHSFLDDNNKDFEKVDYHKLGLVKVYNEIFDNFCYNTLKTNGNFSWKYTIQNYTASGKNQFLRPHSHMPFADFATVHYIQFDNKRHEKTEFLNHNDFSSYISFVRKKLYEVSDKSESSNSYLYENWAFTAEEDDLIIFPSVLRHEVAKGRYDSDKLRVTISSNLILNGVNEEIYD